jgi:hypothetical protein
MASAPVFRAFIVDVCQQIITKFFEDKRNDCQHESKTHKETYDLISGPIFKWYEVTTHDIYSLKVRCGRSARRLLAHCAFLLAYEP